MPRVRFSRDTTLRVNASVLRAYKAGQTYLVSQDHAAQVVAAGAGEIVRQQYAARPQVLAVASPSAVRDALAED